PSLGKQPRQVQHGGVGAAVVHRAVVPRVDMAGKQDEGIWLGEPRQTGLQQWQRAPARRHGGDDRGGMDAAGQRGANARTIALSHRDGWSMWVERKLI